MFGRRDGALAGAAGQVGQLIELLDRADIAVIGTLTRRGSSATIRDADDPWGRRARQRQPTVNRPDEGIPRRTPPARWRAPSTGPHMASDGALHCTSWVAEWPLHRCPGAVLAAPVDGQPHHPHNRDAHGLVGPAKAIR